MDYVIFGLHQILFLGTPCTDNFSAIFIEETKSLVSRLEDLLKIDLSEGQKYYVSRLLISLVTGLVPSLQKVKQSPKKENENKNRSRSSMRKSYETDEEAKINERLDVDRISLIEKFIGCVLKN